MDANFLHGFQGLDLVHLIAFVIIAIVGLRSPFAKAILSWLTGGRLVGNGNGGGNGTKAAIDGINKRLDTHEAECLRRNDEIQSDIRLIKSDVASLNSNVTAISTDIIWIKKLLSYRKGETSNE